MSSREINLDSSPAVRARSALGRGRRSLLSIIAGLLAAASILLLFPEENRAAQYRIDATGIWAGYQIRIKNNSSTPTSPTKNLANVTIKNFGEMDEHFYRGGQPREAQYKELAELGIKTIIDLRDEPLPYARKAAEAANMLYFNIPMSAKDYPSDQSIEEFLNITKEESTWPFYVHCAGGRHRSGVIGAVYRITNDGWDYERAYQEMKKYDFYSHFGHKALKKYVRDYWQRFQTKAPSRVEYRIRSQVISSIPRKPAEKKSGSDNSGLLPPNIRNDSGSVLTVARR